MCTQQIPCSGSSPPAIILASSDSDSSSPSPSFSPISDLEGIMVSDESSKPCSSDASDETGEKLQPANDCSRPDANFETETLTATISTIAEQELSSSDTLQWSGFKIVGNNIDKNIRPSLQRLTHQTKSLHFFHSYAVKDRVNFCSASDARKARPSDFGCFIMSAEDWKWFKDNLPSSCFQVKYSY